MRLFKKKEEVLVPFTVEQCTACGKSSRRQFREGDHVFKVTEKCASCGSGQMMVAKVFGEAVK